MQSLPAKAIILSNTVDFAMTELPSMTNAFARYKDTLTNLYEAKNREKVLFRHLDRQKKELKREIHHTRNNSFTQQIAEIDRLMLNLQSIKQQSQIKRRLEENIKKRNRRKQSINDTKQRELAHKSSIYRYTEKMKAENERLIEIFREKQQKQKEIVVIKERLKQKRRAYNLLEFYQNKMESLKKGKEHQVSVILEDLTKNGQTIQKVIEGNAKLRLKRERSTKRVEKYRTTKKVREHSVISNPQ